MRYLAIYDIADSKRLARVAKIFKDYGTRVQKSKFEMDMDEATFRELRTRIAGVIDFEDDGVKYIPLCGKCAELTEIIGLGFFVDPDSDFKVI